MYKQELLIFSKQLLSSCQYFLTINLLQQI